VGTYRPGWPSWYAAEHHLPVDALGDRERAFLAQSRRAVLATIGTTGRPRLVPVCFALDSAGQVGPARLYIPLDEKPKRSTDPHDLARVKDILQRPAVSLLVDHWDEDWARLAWLRLDGSADVLEPGNRDDEHARAIGLLRERYPQYLQQRLEERPLIRVVVERAVSWGDPGP
jgi:PPOX class probable F420-dependent enzyme